MSDQDAQTDGMQLWDEAEGRIADAQDWTCPACGVTIAGGCGTLTLTKVPRGNMPIPVIMHEQCIDDARRTGTLAKIPPLAIRAGAGDEAAARTARSKAIEHARERIFIPAGLAELDIARRAKEKAQTAGEYWKQKFHALTDTVHEARTALADGSPEAAARHLGRPKPDTPETARKPLRTPGK